MRLIQSGRHGLDIYWQDVFIISHEIAHGLKPDSELAKAFNWSAVLNVSKAVTESVVALNAVLFDALDKNKANPPNQDAFDKNFPSVDLKVLADVLRQNGVDQERVESALRTHATSQRFLNEVSCDSFGITLIKLIISDSMQRMDAGDFKEFIEHVLLAAYRTFLNMRFTGYVTQAVCVHFENNGHPINPIDLDILVEFSLRGRLAVYGIVDAWLETTGLPEDGSEAADFLRKIAEIGVQHTDRLFIPMNALLEQTIYDPDFISSLPRLLEEDGYDSPDFDQDPFKALRFADAFWHIVAS